MRKNRANNGYIGKTKLDARSGVVSASKQKLVESRFIHGNWGANVPNIMDNYQYVRPSSGDGYGASAFATLKNGVLSNIVITNKGSGYTQTPLITITNGNGSIIYGTPTIVSGRITGILPWHTVTDVVITNPGFGFATPPTVSFTSPSSGTGVATTSTITGITLDVVARSSGIFFPGQLLTGTNVSSGTIITGYGTGTGSTGTYTVNINQTVTSTTINGSSTPVGTATVVDGKVTGIGLTYPGARYILTGAGFPIVTIAGGTGLSAAAYAVMSSGTGYTQAPILSIINYTGLSGSGATGYATIQAELDAINLVSGGQDYTSEPTIFIDGESDINLINAKATISGGSITGITFTPTTKLFGKPPTVHIGGWKPLPPITGNDHKFIGTFAIYKNESNAVGFTCGLSFDVDWGDGTTATYPGYTLAHKRYSENLYDGLTQDPFRGYKTVIIQVTPASGFSFNGINLNNRHPSFGQGTATDNWLDMHIAGSTVNGLEVAAVSSSAVRRVNHTLLENFRYLGTNRISNAQYLFLNLSALKKVEMDLSNCTTATSMAQGCYALREFNITNTGKITSVANIFNNCASLEQAPYFDTSNVTNMSGMFNSCYSLEKVPLYNTEKVNTMANMFNSCYSLKSVPYFNTSNVSDMSSMFATCQNLEFEGLPKFNTAKVSNMSSMFSGARSLKNVPHFNTSRVTNSSNMFENCFALEQVPPFDLTKATTVAFMFYACNSLEYVPYSVLDIPVATLATSLFFNAYSLRNVSYINAPNIESFQNAFFGCRSLEIIPPINSGRCSNFASMFSDCYRLTSVPYIDGTSGNNFGSMFSSCFSLKDVNVKITPMTGQTLNYATSAFGSMFSNCYALQELNANMNFSGSTGSANTNIFSLMFQTCGSVKRIAATGFCHNITLPTPSLGPTALNEIYTNLPVVGASGSNTKTITVTGNWGVTGDNTMLAISKGWAVSG